ncbi:MAG: hypothetical protein HY952_01565 [Elusimicrobia bacterium]|nr:hypothetical protein [Elusimicrobiota bacterium]
MLKTRLNFAIIAVLFAAQAALAATPAPKADAAQKQELSGFAAKDMPYDKGEAVLLTWPSGPADVPGASYQVLASSGGAWQTAAELQFPADTKLAADFELPFWAWDRRAQAHAVQVELPGLFPDFKLGDEYKFKVKYVNGKVTAESPEAQAAPRPNLFNLARLNNLVLLVLITVVFFWTVSHAKRKGGLFIRRIAGLDAIDEAIGRATEMGRPIFYSTGIGGMSGVPTIASTAILSEVAKKVASYDTQLKVPHYDPIVMTVCKEVVKQAYTEMERQDSYRDDTNFFVSQDQFSYAAAVDGMIHREKPAACFFIGYFMAESLLLAEVGATTGAIQIAGTDQESQLPFFFTSCDYTLIGEELYAAGAYLSKEPMIQSTLKVQDFGKAFVMVSVAGGSLLLMAGTWFKWEPLVTAIRQIFKAY